ncbi:2-aminoethylphosphonate--pyruvate transaminase [Bacillus sp. PK3_68]|uniref:2-aminoethylphosphonate--pyruvate transaminase n=1 Tax=Bacillus sp. PK3_68 TaxID=2027408 RepID=UPI000E762FDA|nr:2-aminoethylphosphonate--pyruvate transaminase [Bacillus sp. PK3_68]RJS59999.1 2-aminoethylphosphonate--pyruvate transaminase [Bacillus sp. PK3_68]
MENKHYLLLTPGPLTTTETVKAVMMRDWCTWDKEYNDLVQEVRQKLVALAVTNTDDYTAVLMQGSGTFTVEATIGSVVQSSGKLLVCVNGAYGDRIVKIAMILGIPTVICRTEENKPIEIEQLENVLAANKDITHVAAVHCETTTGILNPVRAIAETAKKYGKRTIIDAMSSFGGVEIDMESWQIDFLISSANKCIQGVPGFGFVIANRAELQKCKGQARSLSLDLYDQWQTMEQFNGKWRFTSPTHVVRAFYQALLELEEEGGVGARQTRYEQNQNLLVQRMKEAGFQPFIKEEYHSPIITSFCFPNEEFDFTSFYNYLKEQGFVIYPGKVSQIDTFRIGNIGNVHAADILALTKAVERRAVCL